MDKKMETIGIMFAADTKEGLVQRLEGLAQDGSMWLQDRYRYGSVGSGQYRLAFVAKDAGEAAAKCGTALELLAKSGQESWTQKDIAYSAKAIDKDAKVTVLFSGQGTQQVGMLSEMAESCPEMSEAIALADRIMSEAGSRPVSGLLYPDSSDEEAVAGAQAALQSTDNTQPALAAVAIGLYEIARKRGLQADYFIGHSFGELGALWADGAFDTETFIRLARERGKYMSRAVKDTSMMAVMADKARVQELCQEYGQVYMANENSPRQTVVSGAADELELLEGKLKENKVRGVRLKVSGAFHSPYMKEASVEFRSFLDSQEIKASSGRVIANSTGNFYEKESAQAVCRSLEQQLLSPVLFQSSIEKAYAHGSRIFVEIGNGKVLTNLIKDILPDQEYEAVALCPEKNKDSAEQFEFAMARLAVLGLEIQDAKIPSLQVI